MRLRIVLTSQADLDLTDIWSHIARDNRDAADGLIRRIDEMTGRLAENVELGIRMDSIRPRLMCKPVQQRYLIFYEASGNDLRVLRVLHSARQYEGLF